MWQSFKEYWRPVLKSWWWWVNLLIADSAGMILTVGGRIPFPWWFWALLPIAVLLMAQFVVFHNLRTATNKRDGLMRLIVDGQDIVDRAWRNAGDD